MAVLLFEVSVPKEFFTRESILTFTGVTGMTFVVANGVQKAFDWNPKWLALLIAEVLCLLGIYLRGGNPGPIDYLLGIVNGFLVFCAAAGGTGVRGGGAGAGEKPVARGEGAGERPVARGEGRRGFLTPWF